MIPQASLFCGEIGGIPSALEEHLMRRFARPATRSFRPHSIRWAGADEKRRVYAISATEERCEAARTTEEGITVFHRVGLSRSAAARGECGC